MEQDRQRKGKIPSRRRPSQTSSTTFFLVLFLNSSASDATPEFVNKTEKTLTNNSKRKTHKTDQKNSTADTTAAAERESKLCLEERSGTEEETDRSPLPLRNLYTCAHLLQQQARKALQMHDSGKRAARERERERTEAHLIKEINPT